MCAGGNFGLESQDVAGLHADLRQRLPVEQLLAAGAVVDFVAERLAVGGVLREVHFLQEDGDEAVDRRVVGHLDLLPLVARGVPDLNGEHGHVGGVYTIAGIGARDRWGDGVMGRWGVDRQCDNDR